YRRWHHSWDTTSPEPDPDMIAAEHHLTPREITVLSLLTQPLPAKAIARRLGVSLRTIHKHTENLHRNLRTTDRLTTILRAQTLGLLAPTPQHKTPTTPRQEPTPPQIAHGFPPRP